MPSNTDRSTKRADFRSNIGAAGVAAHVNQAQARKGFAQKAFEDKSTAQNIEYYGGLATDAHAGYRKADLQGQVEREIDSFITGYSADREVIKAGGAFEQLGQRLDSAEADDVITPEERAALNETQAVINKLARAKAQGAANPLELRIRIEAITKQAINNMPGLAGDFRRIANEALGDKGGEIKLIGEEQDAAERAKTAEQNAWKSIRNKAVDYGVDITQPREVWYPEALKRINADRSHKIAKQEIEAGNIAAVVAMTDPTYVADAITSVTNETGANMRAIAQDEATPLGTRLEQIGILATRAEIEAIAAFTADGKVQPGGVQLKESISDMKALYTRLAEGKITAEQLQTQIDIRSKTLINMLSEASPDFAMMHAIGRSLPETWESVNTGVTAAKDAEKFLNMTKLGLFSGNPLAAATSPKEAVMFFDGLVAFAKKYNTDEKHDPAAIEGIVSTIRSTVDKWRTGESAEVYDGLLSLAGDANMNTFLEANDPDGEIKEKILGIAGDFIQHSVGAGFAKEYDPETMNMLAAGGKVYVRAKPGQGPEVQAKVSEIRRGYVDRFNNYILAFSNLSGKDLKATDAILNSNIEDKVVGVMEYNTAKEQEINKAAAEGNTTSQGGQTKINANSVDPTSLMRLLPHWKLVDSEGKYIGDEASIWDFNNTVGRALNVDWQPLDVFYGKDVDDWNIIGNWMKDILESPLVPIEKALELYHTLPQQPWVKKLLVGSRIAERAKQKGDPEAAALVEKANDPDSPAPQPVRRLKFTPGGLVGE